MKTTASTKPEPSKTPHRFKPGNKKPDAIRKPMDIEAGMRLFNSMPDEGRVRVAVAAAICSEGVSTIWRKSHLDPRLKITKRGMVSTLSAGGLRAYLRDQA